MNVDLLLQYLKLNIPFNYGPLLDDTDLRRQNTTEDLLVGGLRGCDLRYSTTGEIK